VRTECRSSYEWKLTNHQFHRLLHPSTASARPYPGGDRGAESAGMDSWRRRRRALKRMLCLLLAHVISRIAKNKNTKIKETPRKPALGAVQGPPARFSGVRDPPPRTACMGSQIFPAPHATPLRPACARPSAPRVSVQPSIMSACVLQGLRRWGAGGPYRSAAHACVPDPAGKRSQKAPRRSTLVLEVYEADGGWLLVVLIRNMEG
jgi:hypothetical protein